MKTNKDTESSANTNGNYIEKDDKQKIKNSKNTAKLIVYEFLALLLLAFSLYLFTLGGKEILKGTKTVDYSLSGNADYKVHLKENVYYDEKNLKSGMQYISSLIDTVDINFNYEGHASENLDYKYKYNVTAKTLVTTKDDDSKVLFEDQNYITKDKEFSVNDTNFVINDVVSIKYDKYNDYIIKYKNEYSLNTNFNLIVIIHVESILKSGVSEEVVKGENDFKVIIPLSEQTINIALESAKYDKSGKLIGSANKTMASKMLYVAGLVLLLISMILIIKVLKIIISRNKQKSIYTKIIDKYLREYDRAIVVTHNSNIDENTFERVIDVSSIEEMIDLHDNLQLPILYYEIIKDKKSYFVIIKDNILYKLTISKAKLEVKKGNNK